MSLKISSVMSIWCSVCLFLAGCTPSLRPAQPVFVTSPPYEPAMLATTRQKFAEIQHRENCHQQGMGCVLIEVVGMPENVPLNRVPIGITVPSGIAAQTNARGWYYGTDIETGPYEVSISLSQDHNTIYRDRQEMTVQSGQPAFLRFEVPIEKVPDHYLPADDT